MSEKIRIEQYQGKINGFIPIYEPGQGNMTRIYLTDGTWIQGANTVRSLVLRLAYLYAVDLKALRNQCSKVLQRKLNLPLPLAPGLTFIPIRVRHPKLHKDGANGYICLQSVSTVKKQDAPPFRCAVVLESGQTISSVSHYRTVLDRLRDGEYLQYRVGEQPIPYGGGDGIPPDQFIDTLRQLLTLYHRQNGDG